MPKHPVPQLQPALMADPARRSCEMPPDLLGAPACQAEATHGLASNWPEKGHHVYAPIMRRHQHYCAQHARQLAGREG